MIDSKTTTTMLLDGLYDCANDSVWREFDARYRPIVVAFAHKLGLNEEDAADVAQETLTRFVRDYRGGKYDRGRGRLRSWLVGIAQNRIGDMRRGRVRRRERRGESALVDVADEQRLSAIWEAEQRRTILGQAIAELREQTKLNETTIQAFEFYTVQGQPAAEVAQRLGITPHDVYMAKSNVAAKLRTILARLDSVFDDGGGC